MTDDRPADAYVLGHSDAELRRLTRQSEVKNPMTRRFVIEAGVRPGMRVLDVGSGAGDVALLLADIVGADGRVVGFDRSARAMEFARSKAAAQAVTNVSFVAGDVADLPEGEPFDAVVGRYVLQFQEEPARLVAAVTALARPGAPIVFHELDWSGVGSAPPVPTYDLTRDWAMVTLERSGATARMGLRLPETYAAAGLPAPELRRDGLIAAGPYARDLLDRYAWLINTLAPTMVDLGIASAAEVDIDTLVERMAGEAAATGSVLLGHTEVGAWARRPA